MIIEYIYIYIYTIVYLTYQVRSDREKIYGTKYTVILNNIIT